MFGRLWIEQKRLQQRAGTADSGPPRAVRFGGGAPAPPAAEAPSRPGAGPEGRPHSPRPGDQRLHEPDGSLLLYVPGGDYTLGADDINDWTRPVHRVHLGPFWIARHPVTNEQYARFLAVHAEHAPPEFWQDERFNGPQQPVVGVSCDDAEAYCRWVGLALPSEAQWEAAARGPEGRTYPWGDEPPEPRHANFGGRLGATSPVDAHPDGGGPFGTLDQAGNVWEWCADSWSLTAYRQRGEGAWNPVSQGETSMRVLRGGSWVNPGRDLRAAYRDRATARLRFNTQGFRCVLPSEPY
jgi:formylglycine-generating enzyme required for sulfatase activity